MIEYANRVDTIVLASGDGDFAPVVAKVGSVHEKEKIVRLASPTPPQRRKCQEKAYDLPPQVSRNDITHPILTAGSGLS
jgi:uncharacterized LabA/DUF88 family protein